MSGEISRDRCEEDIGSVKSTESIAMYCAMLLQCSVLYIILCLPLSLSSANITSKCHTCNGITNRFAKGLLSTAKSNFGGGNTHWEEKKLGSFLNSETRLLEILDHVCGDSGKSECHHMVEENEEVIESWWFTEYAKGFDTNLNTYLCIEVLKVCCPNATFGPVCTPCPGGVERPCNGNGQCSGGGTRDGSGKCLCNTGYRGDVCSDCNGSYFEESRNETHTVCKVCHRACDSTCRGEGPADCDSCANGWLLQEEDSLCVDIDECQSEAKPCNDSQYCQNNEGSYRCINCHPSCTGCTDSGSNSCVECNAKYWRDTASCEPCHLSCMTSCVDGSPTTCDNCANGWKLEEDSCQDIDECSSDGVCDNTTYCVNTQGSYSCSVCHATCIGCDGPTSKNCVECETGYTKNTDNECIDVDECASEVTICTGANEKCYNTLGGFKCNCQDGYQRVQRQCQLKQKRSKKQKKTKSPPVEHHKPPVDPVVEAASKILGEPLPNTQPQPVDLVDQDDMIVLEGNFNIPSEQDSDVKLSDSGTRDDL